MGRYQAQTGEPMSLNDLAKATGLARSIIMSAANGTSTRVDMKTLNTLLDFFATKVEPISTARCWSLAHLTIVNKKKKTTCANRWSSSCVCDCRCNYIAMQINN
jgi:hypothetical protein